MLSDIYRKLRAWRLRRECEKAQVAQEEKEQPEFARGLEEKLDVLSGAIQNSSDVMIRRFCFGCKKQRQAAVLFIDGLIDKDLVYKAVLKPLTREGPFDHAGEAYADDGVSDIKKALIYAGSLTETASIHKAVDSFLSGDTLLLLDGAREVLIIGLRGWKGRGIEEPKTETVVRGPREGFTETLRLNTAMLRRKIKTPHFTLETMQIGARTRTDVCIAYIEGLASPDLIREIRRRLALINTDAILESGYIEEFIEDSPLSIFPTVGNCEKPDKVAAKLLEGRAAILVDGTPIVLTVPMLFLESFQSAEDYYSRPMFSSLTRLMRFASYLISILAPALYVALVNFHQELIPISLLLTMAAAREGIPFPSALEAGLMVAAFEILREAGVRLPRSVGQAISIVGALVIGESAVSAGLIGAPMVVVVSLTAVASFVVPPQTDSGTVMRYLLLILSGFMGGYGIAVGLFALFIHLASLRSFGTPYLSPLAPFHAGDMKDTFVRAPRWSMIKRPHDFGAQDVNRMAAGQKPTPPKNDQNG